MMGIQDPSSYFSKSGKGRIVVKALQSTKKVAPAIVSREAIEALYRNGG
jgi:hypothetical protein